MTAINSCKSPVQYAQILDLLLTVPPRITFLGIEIDSMTAQLRLPAEKLAQLIADLYSWRNRRSCTKRQLLSLIGSLSHASRVIRPGRMFLRRLIDLSTTVSEPHHHIRLNHAARADIAWWVTFVERWNGCSLFTYSIHPLQHSGSWGFGAIWQTHWFKAQWPDNWIPLNIATKELLPIVLASIVWRRVWSSKHVRCHSDNSAVVQAINIRTVKDHNLMRLLCCLFFVEAQFNFRITATHINGSINTAADMLSRNNIANFFSSFPQVSPIPTPIPLPALDILLHPSLVKSAERYFAKSLSTASQRSYAAGTKRYLDFCSSFSLSPFPVSEVNLSSFVSFLADQGLKHQTLKCYLSAVRSAQIAHRYTEPNFSSFPRLVAILNGIKGYRQSLTSHLAKGSP